MTHAIVMMLIVIGVTILGDYFLKLAALSPRGSGEAVRSFAFGASLYLVSAVAVVIAMRAMTLAAFGVWYSVLTILAMTAMSVLLFDERITPREILGIGFALASLACMSRLA